VHLVGFYYAQLFRIWSISVAARSTAWVCSRSPAGIVGYNPVGGMVVSCECCGLPGRSLCVRLITRPEESYRVWILGLILVNVTVAQLVEALRYKPEGRWFLMVSLEIFIDIILPAALWPWGWLSLYQKWVPGIFPGGKSGRFVGLTTLLHSCADCLETWEPQPPGTLRERPGL